MCAVLAIFILIRVICCEFLEPAWLWLNFLAMPHICNTILEEKILKEKEKKNPRGSIYNDDYRPFHRRRGNCAPVQYYHIFLSCKLYRSRRLQPVHLVSCIIRGGTANINFVHNNRA